MTDKLNPKLAQDIAFHMGLGWSVKRFLTPRNAELAGPGGCGLFVRLIWNKPDRVAISGVYPRGYEPYGSENVPEITAAIKKGAAGIAADINRRLYGKYYELFCVKLAALEKDEQEAAAAKAAMLELQAKLDGYFTCNTGDDEPVAKHRRYSGRMSRSVHRAYLTTEFSTYSQAHDMTFRGVPQDLALALAEVYNTWLNAQQST